MSEQEDTFISHLIEMRDRLLRAVLGVVIIFVCLFPWAQDLYALLAKPLLAALPKGGQMIATEVTTPFFVPMKVTLMAAFLLALPWPFVLGTVALAGWALGGWRLAALTGALASPEVPSQA